MPQSRAGRRGSRYPNDAGGAIPTPNLSVGFAVSPGVSGYRGAFPLHTARTARTPTVESALRKLLILDAAEELGDLRTPPGNRLEKLAGDRGGQYSIRVNDQWRICFHWSDGDAYDVELVDYHRGV